MSADAPGVGAWRPRPWVLALCLVLGVLSALRWPQTYTLSQMVIDYHFGFGKRGLLGFVLEHIDRPPYHYATLAWMAFAVFAAWLATLFGAAWPALRSDAGMAAALMLFLLSAGFASLVCDVGRGEHFGLLLGLPCLLMPCRVIWLCARAALLLCAVLVQEANFLIVAPVVAFDVWLGAAERARLRPVLCAAGVLLPATLLTWYLGNARTACDGAAGMAYFQHMAADFTFLPVPLRTLCNDGGMNLALTLGALWAVATAAAVVPLGLVVAVPSALFNIWLAQRVMRGRTLGVAIAVCATLAPLGLLAFGVDVVRFLTLIQLTSLLVLIAAMRRSESPEGGTLERLQPDCKSALSAWAALALSLSEHFHRPSGRRLDGLDSSQADNALAPARRSIAPFVAIAVLELGSGVPLNDGNEPLKFPFTPLVQRVIAVAQGKTPFVVIPGY